MDDFTNLILNKMYRHGDLLIVKVDTIPDNMNRASDKILAYGEATGHKHQLVGNSVIYRNKNIQYVEIIEPSKVVHEEHNEISLPIGYYMIINQREYDPYEDAVRRVQD